MWPLLLGVPSVPLSEEAYQQLAASEHKDSTVVDCDVARSMWSLTRGGQAVLFLFILRRVRGKVVDCHVARSL